MEETPRPTDGSPDVETEAAPRRFAGLEALRRGLAPSNISRAVVRLASFSVAGGNIIVVRRVLAPGQVWGWLRSSRKRLLFSLTIASVAALLLLELLWLLFFTVAPLTTLQKGRQLYSSGHYTEASALLRQEVLTNPQNDEARLLLVQNLIMLRQWPATNGYLSELLKKYPNDPQLYYWTGRAQLGAGSPNSAESSWGLVLGRADAAAEGVKPRVQLALGTLRFRQGQYAEANKLLYEALKNYAGLETTEQQQAFYLYGLLLARDLRFEEALSPLQRAANFTPPGNQWDNAPLRLNMEQTADQARAVLQQLAAAMNEKVEGAKRARLAYAYFQADEYAAAEEQLSQVLRAVPNYAEARAYLGLVYWRTGRSDRALSTLNAALALSPGSKLTRQALAEFLIDRLPALGEETDTYKQEADRTRILLESLTAEQPEDATLQMLQARYYIARHDYQRAQQYYKSAVAINRQRPVAGLNPGAALSRYYSENNFDPCVRGVDTGLEATKDLPGEAESWYAAGLAYSQCGHSNLAIPMLEKALELRPYWPDAIYRLGLAYDSRQRSAEANRLFTLLADLDPGKAYRRQKDS